MSSFPANPPSGAPRGNRNLLLVLAGLVGACICGMVCVVGAVALGGREAIATLLNPPTPTQIVLPGLTPTPTPTTRAPQTAVGTPPRTTPTVSIVRSTPTRVASDTTVVLADNFTGTCNLLEGDNEKRTFKCENGTYTMLNKTNSSRWVYYSDEVSDLVMEADARVLSGPPFVEYGMIFRVSSDGKSFYGFTITRDGRFTFFRYSDPDFTDLITYTNNRAIKTDTATNRLKVIAQGNQMAVYVNDQWLNTISDSTFQRGTFGFFINNRDPNAKVGFSSLKVSQINNRLQIPAGVPTLTATPPR